MPSKTDSQSRAFKMAYAIRKGKLKRSDVTKSVLDIADSDMTDKQLRDFFDVEEESLRLYPLSKYIKDVFESSPYDYINYSSDIQTPTSAIPNHIFIVVKPGFADHAADIVNMFEKEGFKAVNYKTKNLSLKEAQKLYKVHKDKDFYTRLCRYMSSGPSIAILFNTSDDLESSVKKVAKIKDEVRSKWQKDDMKNVIHSSDSPENLWNEMAIFF